MRPMPRDRKPPGEELPSRSSPPGAGDEKRRPDRAAGGGGQEPGGAFDDPETVRDFCDHLEDVVYCLDSGSGRFLYINMAVVELTGYDRLVFLSSSLEEWVSVGVHPDDQEGFLKRWRELVSGERKGVEAPVETRYRLVDNRGAVHHVSDRRMPVVADGDGAGPVYGVIRDLTRQTGLMEDLRRKSLELELFSRLSKTALGERPPQEMGAEILTVLLDNTGFDSGALWLPGGNSDGGPELMAASPPDGGLADAGAPERFANSGEPVFSHIPRREGPVKEGGGPSSVGSGRAGEEGAGDADAGAAGKAAGLSTVCSIPCTTGGGEEGVLLLGSMTHREPTGDELSILGMAGHHIGRSLGNSILRDRAEKYRSMFFGLMENAPTAILALDSEGTARLFNKQAEELTGFRKFEVMGHRWETVFGPGLFDGIGRTAGEGGHIVESIRTKDGEDVEVRWDAVEVNDNVVPGGGYLIMGVRTGGFQAGAEGKERSGTDGGGGAGAGVDTGRGTPMVVDERHLRALVAEPGPPMALFDGNGALLHSNSAFGTLIGSGAMEAARRWESLLEDSSEGFGPLVRAVDEASAGRLRHVGPLAIPGGTEAPNGAGPARGTFDHFLFIPQLDINGDTTHVLMSALETGERKPKWGAGSGPLAQNPHLAALGLDMDDRIVDWNEGAGNIYGWDAGEARGKKYTLMGWKLDPQQWERMKDESLRISRHTVVVEGRKKDGSEVTVEYTVTPVRTGDGRVKGLTLLGRDITQELADRRSLELTRNTFETLIKIHEADHRHRDPGEFMEAALEVMTGGFGGDSGLCYFQEPDSAILELCGSTGIDAETAGKYKTLDMGNPVVAELFEGGEHGTRKATDLPLGGLFAPAGAGGKEGPALVYLPVDCGDQGKCILFMAFTNAQPREETLRRPLGLLGNLISRAVTKKRMGGAAELRFPGPPTVPAVGAPGDGEARGALAGAVTDVADMRAYMETVRSRNAVLEGLSSAQSTDRVLEVGLEELGRWPSIEGPAAFLAAGEDSERLQPAVDNGFFSYGPSKDGLPAPHEGCPKDMADFIERVLRSESPALPQYTISYISRDRHCFAFNLKHRKRIFAVGIAHHTGDVNKLADLSSRIDALGEALGPAYFRAEVARTSERRAGNIARFNRFAQEVSADLDPARIFELTVEALSEGGYFDTALAVLAPMDRAPGRLGGSPEGDVPLEKVEVIPLKKDDLLPVAADRERYVTALRDMTRLVLRNGRGELRRVLTSGSGDPLDSAFHGEGYRSLAAVPLLAGSRKLGSLVMLNRRPRGLGPAELKYFEGIGRFTATAIENMRTLTLWKEKGVMFDRYFEGTRDLWMIMGPDGTVGRASPSATSLTGRTPGEFIDGSADLASMAHDEDRADVEAALRAARAGEAPPEVDLRLLRPDGGLSWVRMGLLNLEVSRTGGSTTLVCVRDINKEKDREAGLREMQRDLEDSNRRLRDIISLWEQFSPPSDFDQFADSVLDVAMASSGAVMGGVLVMEPKLRALRLVTHRGLPADPHEDSKLIELRKRSDLIPLLQSSVIVSGPRLTGMEGALMGPISPSNMSAPMTVPVRAGEMALGMIVLAGAPECEKREEGIKMDSLMGLGRVLAAFIEAYTVNQEAGREMQAKREDLRFFSDMMTHDIHNLNTGALGSLEMALGSADEPARQERYLNRAFSQIVRSSVLIENVKRLRSTDEPYLVGDVDLDAAIRGSVANISVRYPDCALDPRYVPVPAVVRGDRGLVEDVLLNILDNCVKYSDTSTLRVEFDVDPLAPENRVGLVIRDWGGGLPPGQHGEYTGSLEGGSVRPRPGQLGRFLVGHQLKRLGGDLMVEDNIDGGEVVGTRFLLRFVRGGMR